LEKIAMVPARLNPIAGHENSAASPGRSQISEDRESFRCPRRNDKHHSNNNRWIPPYPAAIAYSLGTRSSYAQLVKIYGTPLDPEDQHRYSPSKIKESIPTPLWGNPNPERICTSHVERQNLNIRTAMRRLTRLTNGFSKKWENLKAALALYFAYYNFCRIHSSIRCTPAMAAGITDTTWDIKDLLRG
jgi:hypothetical protein